MPKPFEQFVLEARQGGSKDEYPDKEMQNDDEQEIQAYKPRSKSERDFANKHKVDSAVHPVAPEGQFTYGGEHQDHGPSRKIEGGERTNIKQGSTDAGKSQMVNYDGSAKKGKPRLGDKLDGDRKPVMAGSSKIK